MYIPANACSKCADFWAPFAYHAHGHSSAHLLKLDHALLEELADSGGGAGCLIAREALEGEEGRLPDYPTCTRADLTSLASNTTLSALGPQGACNTCDPVMPDTHHKPSAVLSQTC